jgi:hypothetical protein
MRGPAVRACARILRAYLRRGAGPAAAADVPPCAGHVVRHRPGFVLPGVAVGACARSGNAPVAHLQGLSLEDPVFLWRS